MQTDVQGSRDPQEHIRLARCFREIAKEYAVKATSKVIRNLDNQARLADSCGTHQRHKASATLNRVGDLSTIIPAADKGTSLMALAMTSSVGPR